MTLSLLFNIYDSKIPPDAEWHGDIRLTPFYKFADVQAKIAEYVADINANIEKLPGHSLSLHFFMRRNFSSLKDPQSPYVYTDESGNVIRGQITFDYLCEPHPVCRSGFFTLAQ